MSGLEYIVEINPENGEKQVPVLIHTDYGGYDWSISNEAAELIKSRSDSKTYKRTWQQRFDPVVIQVFREMGPDFAKKKGNTAQYEIVYVPILAVLADAIDITEYDGKESLNWNEHKVLLYELYCSDFWLRFGWVDRVRAIFD